MAVRILITLAAALGLLFSAGCIPSPPEAASRQPDEIAISPESTASPTPDALAWQSAAVPEAGLTLLVPPGWQELEDGGYWSPQAGVRLSVSTLYLPPGTPLSTAFLPEGEYDVFEGRSFASGLGMAEYLGIAVYRSERQANPGRYELHILVSSGDHPAVDFTASAPSRLEVESLRLALERLAAEAAWK
jgi:hypothetical protein